MRTGTKIPWVIEKGEMLRVPSRKQLQMIVQLCNALLNAKVIRGKNGIHIADQNLLFSVDTAEIEGIGGETGQPFEILTPNQGTDDFLTIQVNRGILSMRGWPEDTVIDGGLADTIATSATANFNTDITIPQAAYVVVFLHFNGSNWQVEATDTDDTTWKQFGSTDNKHFMIGYVDSNTDAANKNVIVTQSCMSHTVWPVTGEFETVFFRSVLGFSYAYNGSTVYVRDQSLVVGTVADGFPAHGAYVFIGGGAGVGPGNNWFQISTI